MIPKEFSYPIFEANQVLTNRHLNGVFDYLDEQDRVTRTNLVGIGIVCGLEVSTHEVGGNFEVSISQGCGITSTGYLIVLGEDGFKADRRQDYKLPEDLGYSLFSKPNDATSLKYQIWELLDASHEDYADGRPLMATDMANKVVLLFLELEKENLKNCSPASCDDKGAQVNLAVKKLAISKADFAAMEADILTKLGGKQGDFFLDFPERLGLPQFPGESVLQAIRMPRLDVANSNMQTGQDIFKAYQKILHDSESGKISVSSLFRQVERVLSSAWKAFKPVVQGIAATDPFDGKLVAIETQYLNSLKTSKVIYSQYYFDLLSDLIQAYDEFFEKGNALKGLCCPPAELFPRHLALGEITGDGFAGLKVLRHYFRPSSTNREQERLQVEVRHLFQRMVLMVNQFGAENQTTAGQTLADLIRITPSRYGDMPFSKKAIPHYFRPNGVPVPIHERWDYAKTAAGRAYQNLGYHAETWSTASFVRSPLRYDLEPYNFFQVEGHIGQSWRPVLTELLKKVEANRLPIDIIVLNANNEKVRNNPQINRCITNDLQVIYNVWMKEAECLYKDKMRFLNEMRYTKVSATARGPIEAGSITKTNLSKNKISAIAAIQAKLLNGNVIGSVKADQGTIGEVFTQVLKDPQAGTANDIRILMNNKLMAAYDYNNEGLVEYNATIGKRVEVIASLYEFTEAVPDEAAVIDFDVVNSKYDNFIEAVKDYEIAVAAFEPADDKPIKTQDEKAEILRQLRSILNNCLQDRLKELQAEIARRAEQVEELIYFSSYVKKHPEIQHRAGVPKGGTFILIFEEELPTTRPPFTVTDVGNITANTASTTVATTATAGSSTTPSTATDATIGAAAVGNKLTLSSALTRSFSSQQRRILLDAFTKAGLEVDEQVIKGLEAANEIVRPIKPIFPIPDGVVIADFFLPYRCCSDCPPVQFVLPQERPTFEAKARCAEFGAKSAFVDIKVTKGTAPFQIKIDTEDFKELKTPEELPIGTRTLMVQDALGGISLPLTVVVKPRASFEFGEKKCEADNKTYHIIITAKNASEPFTIDGQLVKNVKKTEENGVTIHALLAGPFESGVEYKLLINDGSGCDPQTMPILIEKCDSVSDGTGGGGNENPRTGGSTGNTGGTLAGSGSPVGGLDRTNLSGGTGSTKPKDAGKAVANVKTVTKKSKTNKGK